MKIAIPLVEGKLCMHFGHCRMFAIVDVDDETREIVRIDEKAPPPHEPGALPRWLNEQGANLVIAGGMGRRAQGLFSSAGVSVVVGAPGMEAREVVELYLSGDLETGDNVCDH